MEKPFAITLDVGSSLANKTGTGAPSVPSTCTACRPATRAAGRREHPAVALRRRGGWRRVRARLAADHGGQPVPGRDGPGLLPPLRGRLQPRPARRGRRDQLGRALSRRRGDPKAGAWTSRRRRRPASGARDRRRPSGCRPPTTSPGSATTSRSAMPARAGGMMRWIPKYRLPRDVLDAEIQRISISASPWSSTPRSKTCSRRRRRAASTPSSSPSARTSASAPTSRPARPPTWWTRSRCCAAWRRRRRCPAVASSSTAAATRRWMRRARRSGSARRRRSSSTGARATGCPRTTSRSRRPRRKAS